MSINKYYFIMTGHNKNIRFGLKYKQAIKRKRDRRNRVKTNKKYKMMLKKRQHKQDNILSDI
jgi:hypothetical protein